MWKRREQEGPFRWERTGAKGYGGCKDVTGEKAATGVSCTHVTGSPPNLCATEERRTRFMYTSPATPELLTRGHNPKGPKGPDETGSP